MYEIRRDCPIFNQLVLHFTPCHASWLDRAELEIGVMERQCLKNCRFNDEKFLRNEVQVWAKKRNAQKIGIKWTFMIKQAEEKFKITIIQN
ncbi:MAG: hypothetical protein ACTSXH_00770 [Promethearchaeota archaeon]